jgi:hypothetical protein
MLHGYEAIYQELTKSTAIPARAQKNNCTGSVETSA